MVQYQAEDSTCWITLNKLSHQTKTDASKEEQKTKTPKTTRENTHKTINEAQMIKNSFIIIFVTSSQQKYYNLLKMCVAWHHINER